MGPLGNGQSNAPEEIKALFTEGAGDEEDEEDEWFLSF